jgi:hypothetical protein
VSGAVVQLSGGQARKTITDANGEYVLGVPVGWYGTVTPVLDTNQFFPNPRSYASLFTTQAGQNYLMVPSLSPTVAMANNGTNLILSWNGLPSVVYLIERSTNLVDWTISSGNFYGGGLIRATNSMDADPVMFFRVRGFY